MRGSVNPGRASEIDVEFKARGLLETVLRDELHFIPVADLKRPYCRETLITTHDSNT